MLIFLPTVTKVQVVQMVSVLPGWTDCIRVGSNLSQGSIFLNRGGYSKIRKLNETQSKFDLDYFDYVNVGGYEQRERIANSLAQ